jgi:PAS domain S-box-containing protein
MSKTEVRLLTVKKLVPQFLLVLFAFLSMVLIGGWFASRIVNDNINAYGDSVVIKASDMIAAHLEKYTSTLNDVAFSMERLYDADSQDKENAERIRAEAVFWTDRIEAEGRFGSEGFYGYLDLHTLDTHDAYFDGSNWNPWAPGEPPYDPQSRPWYTGAHTQKEGIYYSEPYIDAQTDESVVTVSRLLRDADGSSFGVVAVDLNISDIADYVRSLELMDSGYGILLDSSQRIVIHPDTALIREELRLVDQSKGGYAELSALLDSGENISAFHFVSYTGYESVAFFRSIYNGWYVGVASPRSVYYRDVTIMQTSLSVVGFVLMVLLCTVLALMHIKVARSEERSTNNALLLERARVDHERVESVLDATPFGCIIWNKDLKMTECNKAAVTLFGLTSKRELIDSADRLSPELQPDGTHSMDEAKTRIRNALESEDGLYSAEWMYQTPNGTPIPAEITLSRINYAGDIAVAAYIRDLREQKQMLDELQQRDRLLFLVNNIAAILLNSEPDEFETDLFYCMGMMAWSVETDRMYIWKNHINEEGQLCCTQLQEWSGGAEPQQNNEFTTNIPYSENVPEWESILGSNKCINGIVREMSAGSQAQLSPQGILSILVIPVFHNNHFWGFVGFDDCHRERSFTEIEESILRSGCMLITNAFLRNDMSVKVQESLQEAKAASKAKSDFLSNMSHEIRTPMNAVLGMTELLLHEPLDSRQMDYVNDINKSAKSLLSIINDILDMSKIEAGMLELNPINYNFPMLLDNICSMLRCVAEKKNIEFRLETGSNIPELLFGDDIRLRQILTNICGNAVKFTEKGSVVLKVATANQSLLFKIIDTGIGIKKEAIADLFTPFTQTDMQKNRNIVGTGLGLSITKAFVEMMGGNVMIESEYGHGTIFTVMIPLVEGRKDAGEQKTEKIESLFITGANILVVDDNEFNLKVAKGLLGLSNVEACTASSGKEAILSIQENDYDIVFMDHMMPEMDGVETVGFIRKMGKKYSSLPIIALTANAIKGAREMFLANGFSGFISKPIDVYELNSILKEWLPADKIKLSDKLPPKDMGDMAEEGGKGGFMDAVDKIGGINARIGLGYFSGDVNMYRGSLEFFYKKLSADCDKMLAQFETKDISGLTLSSHSIKSQLITVGAAALSETAFKIEAALKENDFSVCAELFPEFHSSLISLHKGLSAIFADDEKPKKTGDSAFLKENVSNALAFINDFNRDECLDIVNGLLTMDFGGQVNALLQKALAALEDFDVDGVIEALELLMKEVG